VHHLAGEPDEVRDRDRQHADSPDLKKAYPPELLQAFSESIATAGPRPVTPYWSDISSAIQSTWHAPSSVSTSTPQKSATFISDVLKGKKLL
jgi:multiple sugar transport system substrate-binding protein